MKASFRKKIHYTYTVYLAGHEPKTEQSSWCRKTNLLCEVASTIRRVEDLIIEHREVPKPNGVSWSQLSQSNILRDSRQTKPFK